MNTITNTLLALATKPNKIIKWILKWKLKREIAKYVVRN